SGALCAGHGLSFGPAVRRVLGEIWVLGVLACGAVDSVIARIMFYVDEDSKGCLSMRDLRRSSLVHIWCSLNPSTELSAVRKFFSYDHFYVLYCTFHELDEDDDFLLHRSDLCKYQGHSISALVEARLFSQAAHSFTCQKPHHINFDDWIWFVLAYHEVTLPKALRFWFDVFDLDGDGLLRDHELEAAFESQAERLRARDGRAQSYKEFICQLGECGVCGELWVCSSDALGLPTAAAAAGISVSDLLQSPAAAAVLINCLLKAHVLKAFEDGEALHTLAEPPALERALFAGFTPFEVYAHSEYAAFTAQRYEEAAAEGPTGGTSPEGNLSD
ncbi:protein phosphatase 2A, putative, partial [Eimeria tenella]